MLQYTPVQHGKNFDVWFNMDRTDINVANFWEEDYFPALQEDLHTLQLLLQDYIENAIQFGEYDVDQMFNIMLSNGTLIDVSMIDPKEAKKRFLTKSFSPIFIVWSNAFDIQFYVKDFNSLWKLQEYTGWFDLDIYDDWI